MVDHKPQLVDHKLQPSKTRFLPDFPGKPADHKPQRELVAVLVVIVVVVVVAVGLV